VVHRIWVRHLASIMPPEAHSALLWAVPSPRVVVPLPYAPRPLPDLFSPVGKRKYLWALDNFGTRRRTASEVVGHCETQLHENI